MKNNYRWFRDQHANLITKNIILQCQKKKFTLHIKIIKVKCWPMCKMKHGAGTWDWTIWTLDHFILVNQNLCSRKVVFMPQPRKFPGIPKSLLLTDRVVFICHSADSTWLPNLHHWLILPFHNMSLVKESPTKYVLKEKTRQFWQTGTCISSRGPF